MIASWFFAHSTFFWVLGSASLVMFVGTIIALPIIIIFLPTRYFNPIQHPAQQAAPGLSLFRLILLVVKNIIGVVLILAGLAMLVLPGQGLVTLLIGLLLTNFPGKRRLICRLLQQPKILSFINRIRTAANRPPVVAPNPNCLGEID